MSTLTVTLLGTQIHLFVYAVIQTASYVAGQKIMQTRIECWGGSRKLDSWRVEKDFFSLGCWGGGGNLAIKIASDSYVFGWKVHACWNAFLLTTVTKCTRLSHYPSPLYGSNESGHFSLLSSYHPDFTTITKILKPAYLAPATMQWSKSLRLQFFPILCLILTSANTLDLYLHDVPHCPADTW